MASLTKSPGGNLVGSVGCTAMRHKKQRGGEKLSGFGHKDMGVVSYRQRTRENVGF